MPSKPGSAFGRSASVSDAMGLSLSFVDGLADGLEGRRNAVNGFRVADAQVAAGREYLSEATDEALACRLIEIDHDVAAENDVEGTPHGPLLHQIQRAKRDEPRELAAHLHIARLRTRPAAEESVQARRRNRRHALERVDAALRFGDDVAVDVGREDLDIPSRRSRHDLGCDHCDAIGILAGRTPRRLDAYAARGRIALHHFRK